MKLVNFKAGEEILFGIQTVEGMIDVKKAANTYSLDVPTTVEEAIARGEEGLSQLTQLAEKETTVIPETEITYAPCVLNPKKSSVSV